MQLDFKQLTPSQCYFAMVQSIIPRPIAWVLSDNGKESDEPYNLAPYSFFTGICSDPPLLMLSMGKKASGAETGQPKDTRNNIALRKHFVVHIAATPQLNPLNQSAATLNHGISEITQAGLATLPFEGFSLPRLESCDIALACSLYRIDEIGNTPQAVIYGRIEKMYVNDDIVIPHESRLIIDAKKLNPLARLGGSNYSSLGELLQAIRPDS